MFDFGRKVDKKPPYALFIMPQTSAKIKEQVSLDGRMDLFSKGDVDVFSKCERFIEADMLRKLGLYPYYQTIDRNEGPIAIMDGKEVIMLGSNNYLGLTIHPQVRKAAQNAIEEFGTSLTGSRLLNGTHKLHETLEEGIASFFGREACLVFSTGYQANLGVISALINQDEYLVIDKADHASIYDAARLGKGELKSFKHNDLDDLERVLASLPPECGKMVMVDGVFSMEGDLTKLPEIVSISKKYGARITVDDAHGVGVIGPCGRGVTHYFGLNNEVDLITGTFSKTLASVGGFVVGSAKVVDFIKHFGRSVLFSASLPPPSAAAAMAALEILQAEPERVDRVRANALYLKDHLSRLGFNTGVTETPIIPVFVGDELLTLNLWRELLNLGVYVNAVLYPGVPKNKSLLRTSVTSEHTKAHLDKVLELFSELKKKHNW